MKLQNTLLGLITGVVMLQAQSAPPDFSGVYYPLNPFGAFRGGPAAGGTPPAQRQGWLSSLLGALQGRGVDLGGMQSQLGLPSLNANQMGPDEYARVANYARRQYPDVMEEQDDDREVFFELAVTDVQNACDVLRPVWDEGHGRDGWVSLEVDPNIAFDTEATIRDAKRLSEMVDRPNVFIKIPATEPGLQAIEDSIAAGIPINVTLIFSLERHRKVAEAYIRGLERLLEGGGDASKLASGKVSLTLNGGDGDDTVIGSAGNDTVIGGRGNDTALLGAGDDTFIWNPGDGSDVVEGQAGNDTLLFNGANVNENIDISANGGKAILTRDVGAVTMSLDNIETIDVNALGGADTITVNDMSKTDVRHVAVEERALVLLVPLVITMVLNVP